MLRKPGESAGFAGRRCEVERCCCLGSHCGRVSWEGNWRAGVEAIWQRIQRHGRRKGVVISLLGVGDGDDDVEQLEMKSADVLRDVDLR